MAFADFASAQSFLLTAGFVIAFIMGAIVNKTHFCTMGAVSDWINMGDTGRFRAWGLAIGIALLGVVVLEMLGMVNLNSTYPPYRNGQLIWAENLLGSILFGIGMTIAGGCGNKCLVRIGGGNLKSIFVFLIIGVVAYFMLNPFPGSDKTLYSVLFYPWLNPLAINMGNSQDLGSVLAGEEHAVMVRLVIGLVLGLFLVWLAFKSKDFRSSADFALGGIVVGLCVLAAWYVTSNISIDVDGQPYPLTQYYGEWDMLAESEEGKPAMGVALGSQSFTFINPMGQAVGYAAGGFNAALLTFGVMAFLGVLAGSFAWALVSRTFRIEWFASTSDVINHVLGAVLMGIGGVLAMGCTVGQAITGVSTLAIGSFLAFAGIVLGSALTMKVQFYQMMYEDEASFGKALITGLVDLKLLPESLRKLEKV
ncbi:MAG TPA: YeeE/YedE family protein [Candidatus Thiothrix moscowensis]|uniref:YeeE/YedE family protein n=1 Tax=unclassified Thiothrix TaxID=2636184 RepID=UPI0025CCF619|nr:MULTISPECIES: YeeE/YedE family protein [unclassified Thiothrix]HRJ52304.1 YeeE/YedE family protein [Candidatus Thiothrix moscowensis]HRJ92619.1 YeeE/YedE family protein [Candidatus Thiothrix moscowensis]